MSLARYRMIHEISKAGAPTSPMLLLAPMNLRDIVDKRDPIRAPSGPNPPTIYIGTVRFDLCLK
jgi:hypothetical protein